MSTVQTLEEERSKYMAIIHHIDAIIAIIANAGPIAPEAVPTAPPPETHGLPMHRHRKRSATALQRASTPAEAHARKPRRTTRKTAPALVNLDAPLAEGAKPPSVRDLVRETSQRIPQPFAVVDVMEYMSKRWPERADDIETANISSVLGQLRDRGELVAAGERQGLTRMLSLYARPS